MEKLPEAIKGDREAEDEKRGERNEESIAIGRDAGPIWIARDKKIKSENACEERAADARLAAPKEKQAKGREKEHRSPGKQAVIGGEEHAEKRRREPEPVPQGDVAGFEGAPVNDVARDEGGK